LLAPTLPTRRFALGVELTESAVLYDGRRLHHNFGVALVTQFALERPRP
jgi:hypothetical protein